MIVVIDKPLLVATATMAQPVVDGRAGEVVIKIENRRDVAMHDLRVRLRETTGTDSGAGRRLAVIPPFDHGYCVAKVDGRQKQDFTFALRPLLAEAGIKVPMELHIEASRPPWEAQMYAAKDPRAWSKANVMPDVLMAQGRFDVEIEARPEIYAAIGALELARRLVERGYDGLKEIGRDTHQHLRTTLPGGAPIEPARVVLGEDSFRGLFELVGAGVRVFEATRRNLGGSGGGGSSGGSSS